MTRDYEAIIKQLDSRKKRIMANFNAAIAIQAITVSVCICGAMFGLSRAEEHYKHQDKVNQENLQWKK